MSAKVFQPGHGLAPAPVMDKKSSQVSQRSDRISSSTSKLPLSPNTNKSRNFTTPTAARNRGGRQGRFASTTNVNSSTSPTPGGRRRRFNDTREIDVLISEVSAQSRVGSPGMSPYGSMSTTSFSPSTDSLMFGGGAGVHSPMAMSQTSLMRGGAGANRPRPGRPGAMSSLSQVDVTGISKSEIGLCRVAIPEGMGVGVTDSPYPTFMRSPELDSMAEGNALRGPAMVSNPDLLQDLDTFSMYRGQQLPSSASAVPMPQSPSLMASPTLVSQPVNTTLAPGNGSTNTNAIATANNSISTTTMSPASANYVNANKVHGTQTPVPLESSRPQTPRSSPKKPTPSGDVISTPTKQLLSKPPDANKIAEQQSVSTPSRGPGLSRTNRATSTNAQPQLPSTPSRFFNRRHASQPASKQQGNIAKSPEPDDTKHKGLFGGFFKRLKTPSKSKQPAHPKTSGKVPPKNKFDNEKPSQNATLKSGTNAPSQPERGVYGMPAPDTPGASTPKLPTPGRTSTATHAASAALPQRPSALDSSKLNTASGTDQAVDANRPASPLPGQPIPVGPMIAASPAEASVPEPTAMPIPVPSANKTTGSNTPQQVSANFQNTPSTAPPHTHLPSAAPTSTLEVPLSARAPSPAQPSVSDVSSLPVPRASKPATPEPYNDQIVVYPGIKSTANVSATTDAPTSSTPPESSVPRELPQPLSSNSNITSSGLPSLSPPFGTASADFSYQDSVTPTPQVFDSGLGSGLNYGMPPPTSPIVSPMHHTSISESRSPMSSMMNENRYSQIGSELSPYAAMETGYTGLSNYGEEQLVPAPALPPSAPIVPLQTSSQPSTTQYQSLAQPPQQREEQQRPAPALVRSSTNAWRYSSDDSPVIPVSPEPDLAPTPQSLLYPHAASFDPMPSAQNMPSDSFSRQNASNLSSQPQSLYSQTSPAASAVPFSSQISRMPSMQGFGTVSRTPSQVQRNAFLPSPRSSSSPASQLTSLPSYLFLSANEQQSLPAKSSRHTNTTTDQPVPPPKSDVSSVAPERVQSPSHNLLAQSKAFGLSPTSTVASALPPSTSTSYSPYLGQLASSTDRSYLAKPTDAISSSHTSAGPDMSKPTLFDLPLRSSFTSNNDVLQSETNSTFSSKFNDRNDQTSMSRTTPMYPSRTWQTTPTRATNIAAETPGAHHAFASRELEPESSARTTDKQADVAALAVSSGGPDGSSSSHLRTDSVDGDGPGLRLSPSMQELVSLSLADNPALNADVDVLG